MALIVEDGTIVASAESYISVADASTYHTARGNAAWAALASDTVREQALRKATDYMQQTYGGRWKGIKTNAELQALDWPRQLVKVDDASLPYYLPVNIIPNEIKHACAELALRAASEALAPDLARAKISETVGEISVTYQPGSPEQKRYRSIDMMVARYLASGGVVTKLYR